MPIFSKIFIPKNFTSREGEDFNYSGDGETKIDEDGQEVRKFRRDGYIEVTINIEVAKAVFDMADGYFNHLERIAYFCNSAYTSRLYLLLMKYASKGQMHPVIDYRELKDALGMFKVDVEKSDDTQPAKVVTTEKYQKFSQFRKQVLDVARGDMERLCEENKIEIMLSCIDPDKKGYEPIYRGSVKRGNPEKIKFHIKRTPLGVARELELHRGSSEKRLCAKLTSLYPTLDRERLKAFVADVPEDLWNDFKAYAYNGVPKAVEKPHRWSGTMEDFVFYIMEQWIKQHSANTEAQQQSFAFDEVDEVKPGEKEWDAFLTAYRGAFANIIYNFRFYRFENNTVHVTGPRDMYVRFQSAFADNTKEALTFFRQLSECYGLEVQFRIIHN